MNSALIAFIYYFHSRQDSNVCSCSHLKRNNIAELQPLASSVHSDIYQPKFLLVFQILYPLIKTYAQSYKFPVIIFDREFRKFL